MSNLINRVHIQLFKMNNNCLAFFFSEVNFPMICSTQKSKVRLQIGYIITTSKGEEEGDNDE